MSFCITTLSPFVKMLTVPFPRGREEGLVSSTYSLLTTSAGLGARVSVVMGVIVVMVMVASVG